MRIISHFKMSETALSLQLTFAATGYFCHSDVILCVKYYSQVQSYQQEMVLFVYKTPF